MSDTIFALSSGPAPSGVAVIRLSGPKAGVCLQALSGSTAKPRHAHLRVLTDQHGREIDQALVMWFPAPHSFTGEDIAEFHIHGGQAVIASLSRTLLSEPDVRLAEAGEFSLRAYRNGKMDLTELEGLADIIHAKTEFQRQQAVKIRNGWNRDIFDGLRHRIIGLLGHVEASIDFTDEELDLENRTQINKSVQALVDEIDSHLKHSLSHESLRDGFRVVLTGPVNVGKSSLLNRLAQRDAAIVSDHAGTTRDIIEVQMDLEGYPVLIQDTAGLRQSDNPVENLGMQRSRDAVAKADLIISMRDHDRSYSEIKGEDDLADKMIHVRNKIDLDDRVEVRPDEVRISVNQDEGIDQLIAKIGQLVRDGFQMRESGVILRLRHRDHLENCIESLQRIAGHADDEVDLISEDIRHAASHIGAITGRIDVEDMLDRVFSDFCIGK